METVTLSYEDYKIGWICALPVEMTAAIAMLDELHTPLQRTPGDDNTYVLGRVGDHNVAIASLPIGERGTNSAAQVAVQMLRTFQSIKIGLMVGVGGGVPSSEDIRLGDIVVSKPSNQNGGVFQYDLGRNLPGGFRNFGFLNAPPRSLRSAISALVAWHDIPNQNKIPDYLSPSKNPNLPTRYAYPKLDSDDLFKSEYIHEGHKTCADCDRRNLIDRKARSSRDPVVHYGTIASGNQIMGNGLVRDELAARHDVLCFEMEAAGLMNTFPCVVIRGICHYADSHKYSQWQPYAAATAAAYAKELLRFLPVDQVSKTDAIAASTSHGEASSSIAAIQTQIGLPLATATIGELTLSQPQQSIPLLPTASPHKPNSNGLITSGFSVLTDGSLNWDQVVLGHLVLNLDDPAQDYYPPAPIVFAPEDIGQSPFNDIQTILNQPTESRFIEGLKKLLPQEINGNTNAINEIATQKLITYKLVNSEEVFDRLLENNDTRRWLERLYRKSYIYFSVAIHVIASPSVSKAAGNPIIGHNDTSVPAMDQVIGVRYRRLRFQKFCSNADPASLLQRGCWKIYDGNCNSGEEADSLKVTLDDAMLLDDLEDEYNFEVHSSNNTEETYIALVCISLLQKLNARS